MRPVTTVAEMRAADQATIARVGEKALVERAGTAVARGALAAMNGAYGRRVVVVAGKGNNGADGRVAAGLLRRRGARVAVIEAGSSPALPPCDLVIDAAYGTGFRGTYDAPPRPPGAAVLAVDVPSGVEGDTGQAAGHPMPADRTVTLGALKPAHLQWDGALLSGKVTVAPIGIELAGPLTLGVVEDRDVAALLPRRGPAAHKWETALAVVAGSPGMEGAASLCATGASHSGAGMVRLAVPGSGPRAHDPGEVTGGRPRAGRPVRARLGGAWPLEAVRVPLSRNGWAPGALEAAGRCRALVIGPGLGRTQDTVAAVRTVVASCPVPVVVDADALWALGTAEELWELAGARRSSLVLTPHDGEYQRLAGTAPGADRREAAQRLAERTGAVVLLKGWPTVVATPRGPDVGPAPAPTSVARHGTHGGPPGWPGTTFVTAGSPRLATAGTGDVLAGVIGAFVARGLAPATAAALGAHAHGRAAGLGPAEGLVAGDLPDLLRHWLSDLLAPPAERSTPQAPRGPGSRGKP